MVGAGCQQVPSRDTEILGWGIVDGLKASHLETHGFIPDVAAEGLRTPSRLLTEYEGASLAPLREAFDCPGQLIYYLFRATHNASRVPVLVLQARAAEMNNMLINVQERVVQPSRPIAG
ncbi:hypothetical protein E4U43_002881 [Claviceps pusilla]|uniref:Uncharacterized protein n=1 Tax=Claviceps pusilla TaxID=123648 RepID=A0A9P7NFV9_9HYPO|nr:hypothetical protein E4U43_002881 [Claviceps pusilla]